MKFRLLSFGAVVAIAAALFAATQGQQKRTAPVTPDVAGQEGNATSTSIALRVRRITYEDAYVAVPVTDSIMKTNDDGTPRLNFEAFVAEAIRISKDKQVEWKVESSTTEAHPTQQPLPETRKRFDAFHGPSAKP